MYYSKNHQQCSIVMVVLNLVGCVLADAVSTAVTESDHELQQQSSATVATISYSNRLQPMTRHVNGLQHQSERYTSAIMKRREQTKTLKPPTGGSWLTFMQTWLHGQLLVLYHQVRTRYYKRWLSQYDHCGVNKIYPIFNISNIKYLDHLPIEDGPT